MMQNLQKQRVKEMWNPNNEPFWKRKEVFIEEDQYNKWTPRNDIQKVRMQVQYDDRNED